MFNSKKTWDVPPTAVLIVSLILFSLSPVAAADDLRCLVSFDSARLDVCAERLIPAREEVRHLGDLEAFRDSGVRVVKFDGPIFANQRAALEALGAEILGYAPFNAYIVRMPAALDERAAGIDGVLWTGPFLPIWKVEVNIATELAEGSIVEQAGLTQLTVSLHAGVEAESVVDILARRAGLRHAVTEIGGSQQRLVFDFARDELAAAVSALSTHDDVAAVGLRWPPQFMNSQAAWLHQSGVGPVNPERPVFDRGIFGCGQIIGVLDSGLHVDHCSFEDTGMAPVFTSCGTGATCPAIAPDFSHRKVGAYYKWSGLAGGMEDTNAVGHGTHVAGSAIGNDHASPVDCAAYTTPGGITNLDGSAPGAKLVLQDAGPSLQYLGLGGTVYHAASVAFQNGARIHNNSWGYGCRDGAGNCIVACQMTYHFSSRDADEVVWDNPELALFAAAGNSGGGAGNPGCGLGNDVGAPGNAKNVFSIGNNRRGSLGNDVWGSSSRGPAPDRRTRPDMTAQGASIISSHNTQACGTRTLTGTSMASPTAAGLAALAREYLARGFYPTGAEDPANVIPNPSGALIRAMMINGAVELTGTGAAPPVPNQNQGWGRVHLDNVLYFAGDSRQLWFEDNVAGVDAGVVVAHTVNAQAGEPLVVTLVWHDFPAMTGANPAIVNQLRLEVETPAGEVWTQKLPPGGGLANADPFQDNSPVDYDDLNTVHRITLPVPATDDYEIRVMGVNVPQGPQPYALAVTGALQPAGPPVLDIVPPDTDFGAVTVGQVSAVATVQLVNTGAVPVEIDNVPVPNPAGPFHHWFNNCPMPPPIVLPNPGDSCEVEFVFQPVAAGMVSETIDVTDPNGVSLATLTLQGTGTAAPELTITPDPVDFGVQRVNDFSSLDVTFTNTGTAPLDVAVMDAPGTPFNFFGLGTCPAFPFTLQPGDDCTRNYVFEPSADGVFSQQIDVASTDPNPNNFTLQGEGVHAVIDIDPSNIDFGPVAVGSQAVAGMTVSNAGAMFDIDVFNPAMSPMQPEFDIQPGTCAPFPFTLAPGQDCELEVSFTPSAPGPAIEINELVHDASDGSADYTLQGLGIDGPWLVIDPLSLEFGAHLVGQASAPAAITYANIGNAPLDITAVTPAPAPFDEAGGTCLPLPVSLNPGDDCTLEFTFEPPAPGGFAHPMVIDSNDPNSPHGFELRGDGVVNPVFDDRFEEP